MRATLSICLAFVFLAAPGVVAQEPPAPETASFAIPADSQLPGAGPMRRYDWFQNVWNRRRGTFAAHRQRDRGAVVFLGDSITQGWKDDFSGAFPNLAKANRGISGDTTRGMLYRLEEDVLSLDPAAIVMLMGTNDLEEGARPETIAGNVQLIVERLRQHDPELPIVLCEVFPSSESKSRPAAQIQQLNQLYRDLARGNRQITLLETYALFADQNGNAKRSEFPDLLHPNALGYLKWQAALKPIFATLGLVDTEPDTFEFEPDAEPLFNGRDLTGWGYRPTSETMRKTRQRVLETFGDKVAWPLVEEAVAFDGKTQTPDGRYRVIAERLTVTTPTEGRKIQILSTTEPIRGDFQLKLEFRATPNADSGVFVRGKQLQCRDYPIAGPYKQLRRYRPGGWNELVITVRDNVAHCTCNGEVLEAAMQVGASGPIGLEGDRGQVEYRRIRIRRLN